MDRAASRLHPNERPKTEDYSREFSTGAVDIFHFGDGVVVEQWVNVDSLRLLQQIGAIRAPAQ